MFVETRKLLEGLEKPHSYLEHSFSFMPQSDDLKQAGIKFHEIMHLTPIFNSYKTQTDSHGEFRRRSTLVSHLCVQQSWLLSLDLILNSQINPRFSTHRGAAE